MEVRGPFLVIGLGNPGIEYQWTPHNAGFLAIDRVAERTGATVNNRRCRALTATTQLAGREVVLAKPGTFMNLSGLSVRALVEELGATQQDVLILYDELALPLGTLRVRAGGSSGGHNGARSINGALGTEEWARIRIGVGPDGLEDSVAAGEGLPADADAKEGTGGARRGAGPRRRGRGNSHRERRVRGDEQVERSCGE